MRPRRDPQPAAVPITRVLGYVRVSTDDQTKGTSPERQRDDIREHARRAGLPEPLIFEESESAVGEGIENRTKLRRLLATARQGDLVVVAKQDRWSRDTLFFLESMRRFQRDGVRFFSLAERFDPDTAEGLFASTIMAAVAQQEAARIRDRTIGGLRKLRSMGKWAAGKPPFGYRVKRPERHLERHPERAWLIVEAARRCIHGDSVRTIARWLSVACPSRTWDLFAVRKLLTSRHYLGEIRLHDGRWIAAHEPLVDRATWERVREALESRRLGGRVATSETARTATWLLRGLMRCGVCGAKVGARYGSHFTYYACARRCRDKTLCDSRSHRQEDLDARVAIMALERIVELRHEIARAGEPEQLPTDTGAAAASLRARRSRIVDLYERARIDADEFDRRVAVIDAEIGRLAVEEARAVPMRPEARAELLHSVEAWALVWTRATPQERREITRRLAREIRLTNDGPAVTWRAVAELAE